MIKNWFFHLFLLKNIIVFCLYQIYRSILIATTSIVHTTSCIVNLALTLLYNKKKKKTNRTNKHWMVFFESYIIVVWCGVVVSKWMETWREMQYFKYNLYFIYNSNINNFQPKYARLPVYLIKKSSCKCHNNHW